jgi:hypothetical protein
LTDPFGKTGLDLEFYLSHPLNVIGKQFIEMTHFLVFFFREINHFLVFVSKSKNELKNIFLIMLFKKKKKKKQKQLDSYKLKNPIETHTHPLSMHFPLLSFIIIPKIIENLDTQKSNKEPHPPQNYQPQYHQHYFLPHLYLWVCMDDIGIKKKKKNVSHFKCDEKVSE